MKPMVILTGPTAVGKTELSIRLAKILNAEIISADSMQVYKKMDIGTAKIRPEEMEGSNIILWMNLTQGKNSMWQDFSRWQKMH